ASCKLHVMTDFHTKCAHCVIYDLRFVCTKEHDVAIFSTNTFQQIKHDWLDEFHDWRLKTFNAFFKFVDFDVSQTTCTIDAYKFSVFVNCRTWKRTCARYAKGNDTAFRIFCRTCEYLELNVLH